MRRRSKTNSRPHKDPCTVQSYLYQAVFCEYCEAARKHIGIKKCKGFCDPDHIYLRYDYTWNLMACCRESHRWKHANLKASRVVAWWWKLRCGDFDRFEMKNVLGIDPVGMVENYREDGLPDWADEFAADFLEKL